MHQCCMNYAKRISTRSDAWIRRNRLHGIKKRVDDRKCQGDSDPGRSGVTGGDPEFSCVTRVDLT